MQPFLQPEHGQQWLGINNPDVPTGNAAQPFDGDADMEGVMFDGGPGNAETSVNPQSPYSGSPDTDLGFMETPLNFDWGWYSDSFAGPDTLGQSPLASSQSPSNFHSPTFTAPTDNVAQPSPPEDESPPMAFQPQVRGSIIAPVMTLEEQIDNAPALPTVALFPTQQQQPPMPVDVGGQVLGSPFSLDEELAIVALLQVAVDRGIDIAGLLQAMDNEADEEVGNEPEGMQLQPPNGAVVALVQTDEDAPMNGGEMEQMTEAEVASPDLQVIGTAMQYHPGAATLTTWLEVYTRPYEVPAGQPKDYATIAARHIHWDPRYAASVWDWINHWPDPIKGDPDWQLFLVKSMRSDDVGKTRCEVIIDRESLLRPTTPEWAIYRAFVTHDYARRGQVLLASQPAPGPEEEENERLKADPRVIAAVDHWAQILRDAIAQSAEIGQLIETEDGIGMVEAIRQAAIDKCSWAEEKKIVFETEPPCLAPTDWNRYWQDDAYQQEVIRLWNEWLVAEARWAANRRWRVETMTAGELVRMGLVRVYDYLRSQHLLERDQPAQW